MSFSAHTWQEVRDQVIKINPGLAKAIDDFEPDNSYLIYKATYPWGESILSEGQLMIPHGNNRFLRIDDPKISKSIYKDLFYNNTMPLGIVLKNTIELYYDTGDRLLPFSIMPAGKLFALWVSFQSNDSSSHTGRTSNINSGARSVIMGPKITDGNSFRRLSQQYKGLGEMPSQLKDHWQLFKNVCDLGKPNWESEVFFFSRKWIEDDNSVRYRLLRQYFLEVCWEGTAYLRDQSIFDLVFSQAIKKKNLKPNPYLVDTVKHLYHIGRNVFPGFCAAHNETYLPLSFFEEVFLSYYGLKYAPTIFHLGNFSSEKFLYYSLEYPTLASFSPKSKKFSSKLEDLREIKHIIRAVIKFLEQNQWNFGPSPIQRLLDIDFQYLHSDEDPSGEVASTKNLAFWDSHIVECVQRSNGKPFAESCQILRGSILVKNAN